jgi:lipoyl(octanoyl) transferase
LSKLAKAAGMALRSTIFKPLHSPAGVRWEVEDGLVPYPEALDRMDREAAAIAAGNAEELVWLLEHPPLYTAGTSAKASDLLKPDRFPVYASGRGGQYTYHGPGQRIAYVMLDLRRRGEDVRAFVAGLEEWIMATLAEFGVRGERREDRVGVWVQHDGREDKIAAIGIRLRRWISLHGISINIEPDLSHFDGIVPCGVSQHGVTSLQALGVDTSMTKLDAALRQHFHRIFGAP